MPETLYRSLVWLDYRLAVLFSVALPLVLLVWASLRREGALVRLLQIYWKVASLLLISVLLLANQRPLGFLMALVGQLLVVLAVWFWVDINEELADLPPWRPLPLTVRIWRWSLTFWALLGAALSATSLACLNKAALASAACIPWLQAPQALNVQVTGVFGFVFGAQWSPTLAGFVGYLALVAYVVGLLQWLLVRLPKQGRVAGEF
ncbi:DUF3177 family protein [Cyanobium sp. WAJ14-Wanaka]|uniref:DUF3177 family protein n=1 Tax=Cyanobium sp. WAJ14-Wanaka TaxID=2823725 RepID=UPI0020CC064D|nr:DUF3177 family protein [Cyanobium sp. WAJ14-Wanaka]MCP9775861.1 DUF3177 family protein [Cyanobium sp. WAJ14-Wanaka]